VKHKTQNEIFVLILLLYPHSKLPVKIANTNLHNIIEKKHRKKKEKQNTQAN